MLKSNTDLSPEQRERNKRATGEKQDQSELEAYLKKISFEDLILL